MAVARKADIPVLIDALGTVTPVTTITLRPQVSGVMTDVLFAEGQTVKKGDVLARIDPRPFEQALMQAQGTRQRDEAQLQAARVTLERFRTLLTQDSIARQEVDTQAALVKQLEGTVLTDRASEAAARLNLDFTSVRAPVGGRVGLRTVDPGNYVAAGAATGIAVITQMAPIDVQFTVPQDRVPEIQARVVGDGAKLPVTAFDRTRSATLDTGSFSTLDNVVDTTTGTVKAKARFANAQGTLFPSQFVNIRLLLRTIAGAVTVPVTAVRTSGTGNYVYVINEDRTVSMRMVKRGDSTVEAVVITDGLAEGEQVVTEGGDRLKDGSRVSLPSDAPGARARGAASGPRGGASGPRRRRGAE
ncbi:MAG: efflux RND transporter periplasmic adaptor subunit [Comamonadaceae bacterium]|nr:MAG: efflux RND transporter periplasmic adaptor subunit [Comamonadaceae bacterium]